MKQLILKSLRSIAGLDRIHERITPLKTLDVDGQKLQFFCPNALIKYRIDTYFSKEPKTLSWIDGLAKDEVLFDIGGNIGLYSMYAGLKGLRVYAFEPDSLNFAQLNKNIQINHLDSRVSAYNVALSDKCGFGRIYIGQFMSGASFHQVDKKLQAQSSLQQGICLYTLDAFCRDLNIVPNHLKIDVDGNERAILQGASQVLSSPKLKSVLIEIDTRNGDTDILSMIEAHGLKVKETHPLNPENTVANYVLVRK